LPAAGTCARHRLDAVDAGAEIHAIEVQLEDLRLRQLRFNQDRDARFLELPPVRPDVGEKQRPRELLRQRAAPFDPASAPEVANDGAPETDGVDAGV